jgi:uncharacterized protein (DUF58 family)
MVLQLVKLILLVFPQRRIRFTREGWFFLAVTFAIGLAALNTGHNLFYLIFAMLVSMIVVSGMLSERAVRSLRLERRLPAEVFARSAAALEMRVRNESSRRSLYAVEIRDGRAGEPRRRVGFVDRLDAQAERSFPSVWSFERRGRARFASVHLVTRFPFGLFEKTRIVTLADDIVVFPAVDGDPARGRSLDAGPNAVRKHRLGEETIGLRPMVAGDDPRRIHWRVSARAGERMVIESGEASSAPLAIFFDDRGPAGPAFERAVERAASLVWEAGRAGRRVDFDSFQASFRGLTGGGVREALAYLAEVEPFASEPCASVLERWRSRVEDGAGGLFVTAGEPPALSPGTVLRVVA